MNGWYSEKERGRPTTLGHAMSALRADVGGDGGSASRHSQATRGLRWHSSRQRRKNERRYRAGKKGRDFADGVLLDVDAL